MEQPKLTEELITPEKAREYLGHNLRNRNVRRADVKAYADDMASGNWRYVGDPIKFSKQGRLIDGQHRLIALVDAGVTLKFAVMRGLDLEDQLVLDTGIRRTFGDHLKFLGETNASWYASIIRAVTVWNTEGHVRGRDRVPFSRLEETYEKYPELKDSLSVVRFANETVRTGFVAGGLVWWLLHQRDAAECGEFFYLLSTGEGLGKGHPIYALRRILLADVRKGRTRQSLPAQNIAALMIKAWNKWKLGEQIEVLVWRGGGSSPEDFPEILS